MTLSVKIYTKTSKSPGKFVDVSRYKNKVRKNTFINTLEDDLKTFSNITSHIKPKYRWDLKNYRTGL